MIPAGGIQEFVTRVLLVPPQLWAAAARRAQSGRELDVLALLRKTPAEWAPPDDPTMAVTEHQFKQIAGAKSAAALGAQLWWNSYVILEPIGKGGMGVVFKGWDAAHKRYVALKRPLDASREMVERLNREAQLLAHITHPNLARLFAHERHADVPLLVLEFVTGTNLRHVIDAKARAGESVPWQRVAEWGVELLSALGAIHAATVIHRDVKPENVMLRERGQSLSAVLLDMGLGKSLQDVLGDGGTALTHAGTPVGTFTYLPPEQWSGKAETPSDVYSLAATLFEVLAGRPPFTGSEIGHLCHRHCNIPPPRVREFRPDVPPEFDALLDRMLAKDPRRRGAAPELAAALRHLLGRPARPPTPPPVEEPESLPFGDEVAPAAAPAPPVDPPDPEDYDAADDSSWGTIVGTGWKLARARLRLAGGPPAGVAVAAHERMTRREVGRLARQFRGGVRGRLKMLAFPWRTPVEWALFLVILALLLKWLRVW